MSEMQKTRANCRFCGYLCGMIATIEDDRVVSVEPDTSRYPYDASIQRGCQRGGINVEFLDHPGRVNYPLKRIGERGSGNWQRVSWSEALDDIALKLRLLKERFGAETLATSIGGPHASYWPLHRFMTLFGSPNNMGIGQTCWNPGVWLQTLTFGWPIENELDPENTNCALVWGANPAESDNSLFWRTILAYRRTGKPLIVIDPRLTRTAAQADFWLPVRPGTDPFLGLGLLNVILSKELFDDWFVKTWCEGFDLLKEHAKAYPPALVERITGVPAENIIVVARLFAQNSPASIISGRGIDQLGRNTIATHQALSILRAITGNVDLRGACHLAEMPDFIPEVELELSHKLHARQRQKSLNTGQLFLQSYTGYERISKLTGKMGRQLPMRYLTSAHPNLVWRAMLDGEPYPVRALVVMGTNPLLTAADTQLVYRALKSLDLLVALEQMITPTAMLADYIFPSAGGLERPLFQTHAGTANIAYGGAAAIKPLHERRPDFDFWKELGTRLGQSKHWPWNSFEESLNDILNGAGLTWEQFCENGLYYAPSSYQKHEQTCSFGGKKNGFATSSGKVELCSNTLSGLGYSPLPNPSSPTQPDQRFPLMLISGARKQPFNGSALRQINPLRAIYPEPIAEMSSATAVRLGLEDGERVSVETLHGSASFKLQIAKMLDEVVSVDYGWWFPELPACEPELGGIWLSNANVLTSADIETSDPLIGTWTFNGVPCRISPQREKGR